MVRENSVLAKSYRCAPSTIAAHYEQDDDTYVQNLRDDPVQFKRSTHGLEYFRSMFVTNTGRIGALPGQNIDMRRLLQYSIKKYGVVTVDNYGNLYESFKDTSRAWSRFTHTFSETSKYIQLVERESVRSISTDKRNVLKRKLRELMIGLSGVEGLDNPVDEESDDMDGTNSSFVRETASPSTVPSNVIDTTIFTVPIITHVPDFYHG